MCCCHQQSRDVVCGKSTRLSCMAFELNPCVAAGYCIVGLLPLQHRLLCVWLVSWAQAASANARHRSPSCVLAAGFWHCCMLWGAPATLANVHTCVVWTLALLVRDVTDSNQAPCVFVACAIMMLRVDLLSFRMPGCGQADSRTLSLPRPVGCRAPFVHCL
jgi:hypothetical protein